MKINMATSAVIVALITGVTGLATSIVNRYTPNEAAVHESERTSRKGYKAIRRAAKNVAEDVDALAKRLDTLEQTAFLQNKVIASLLSENTSGEIALLPEIPRAKSKRVPTTKRGEPPTFDAAQRAK